MQTTISQMSLKPSHHVASHVAMSVNKLLSRIVRPSDLDLDEESGDMDHGRVASALHDHTYGCVSSLLAFPSLVFPELVV